MASSLREDENFVIEALCNTYGGTWRVGEDPPDAYILIGGQEIAVEISILTQHVTDKSGKLVPRLSQDSRVIRLCDELDEEFKSLIPSGVYIMLTISAPLNKIRKTKDYLIHEIKEIVQRNSAIKRVVEINKNRVKIQLISGDRLSGKKVVGVVSNQNSNADILANAEYILNERINEKTKKCSKIVHRPLWLALFNDYWLAGLDTYKLAMKNLSITHQFDKICIVFDNKQVYTL